jgi:predicted acyltransferase (DUF342 family)
MAADYTLPQVAEKRTRFFDGQFLTDQDFVDEQKYHLDRQRRHQRLLHVSGICEGLQVRATGDNTVTVDPGTAVDPDGRTLALAGAVAVDLPAGTFNGKTGVTVYLTYQELTTDQQKGRGSADDTRWLERPAVVTSLPGALWTESSEPVPLARLSLDSRGVVTVDAGVREYSGVRLPGAAADAPTLRATPAGEVRLNGSLTVDGDAGVGGDVTLEAGRKISASGRLHIGGDERLFLLNKNGVIVGKEWEGTGELTVEGALTAQEGVAVNGAVSVVGTFSAADDATFGNNLSVAATSSFAGNVGIGGDLTLAAAKKISSPGRLHITGDERLYLLNKNGVIVGKEWGGTGDLTVEGALKAQGDVAVTGAASVGGSLSVTGAASVGGNLSVAGTASVKGSLSATGAASFAGDVTVNGALKFTGNLATGALGRVTPFLLRGTGFNNSAARVLTIGSTNVYTTAQGTSRGLALTILKKSDHSVVSTTVYDTYATAAAVSNLVTALNGITKDQLGILASCDSWEAQVSGALRTALQRLGLYRAAIVGADGRRPYAAVFEAATTVSTGTASTAKAVEVLYGAASNFPSAEIRGWLVDGTFIATGAAPNALANNLGAGPAVVVDEDNKLVVTGAIITCPGRLHISGEENLYLLNKGGVIVGKEWGGNGNLLVEGVMTQLSDARLKTRIRQLESTLDRVTEIRGVSYLQRQVGELDVRLEEQPAIGVIAQEVEAVFPELVSTPAGHAYKGVSYSGLTAVLLEAVKELKAALDPLRTRVDAIEARA